MNIFFFKKKTAYEMRISDWSSDVCSSDFIVAEQRHADGAEIVPHLAIDAGEGRVGGGVADEPEILELVERVREDIIVEVLMIGADRKGGRALRLAEGQVDRLAGFLAERRGAEFIGFRGEMDTARITLLHIGRALRPRDHQHGRIVTTTGSESQRE